MASKAESEWWGVGLVVCLERGADLHMAQLMPLPLTVSCFSEIQIGFTFLVPAYPGSRGSGPLNGCVYCWICGISWAICTSAPRSRQTTMPAPHHSVFTGRMPFLPPNQQRQSTEGSEGSNKSNKSK